jgi:hypothetical protein
MKKPVKSNRDPLRSLKVFLKGTAGKTKGRQPGHAPRFFAFLFSGHPFLFSELGFLRKNRIILTAA